jgi:transcriptional regulator with XRE-family HTH domain
MTSGAAAADAHVRAGARLARARRTAGLTQRALADRLGTSLIIVDAMEAGRRDPTPFLERVAEATGTPLSAFVPLGARTMGPTSTDTPKERAQPREGLDRRNLVLAAIVLLVTVRFFTEVEPILPRAANFIDIPIFLVAIGVVATQPSLRTGRWYLRAGPLVAAFLVLSLVSVVLNISRVDPAPVIVFVYGFLAPIVLYAITYRVWPAGNTAALSRSLVGLGIVQLAVVVLVDLPSFVRSHDPDEVSGTFGTNAYQLVYVLLVLVALVVGIATFEPGTRVARFAVPLVLAFFIVMLLAQYRALLVSTVVAIFAVAYLLKGRGRGVVAVGVASVAFGAAFYYVATNLSFLKLDAAARSVSGSPTEYVKGRAGVVGHVLDMYTDMPATIAVGSGPGTYSSRAWQTFAKADSTSRSNVVGGYATSLTGGHVYSTDVSEKYVAPQIEEGRVQQGSRAISNPYSSYASLMAEVGLLGAILIVSIYLGVLVRLWRMASRLLRTRRPGDPLPAVIIATFVAFLTLLQMAFLENWFEVTRITFIVWIMFAVCCKELDAREAR